MPGGSSSRREDHPSACPACLAATIAPYCRRQEANYFICRSCALIFQHPLPTGDSMVAWADEEYASGAYRDYVEARPMKIRHFEDRLADIGDRVRPGRLLDVGCSCGYFLEVAASRGFEVHGVEFSRNAIAAASPTVRDRIVQGTLENLPIDGLFDVVSAFDLIEHVPEPRALLRRCASLLKPGGTLLLSTPDTGHFLRFVMRSRWPMLQPMQHLFLFSRRALARTLQTEGFEDVSVDTAYKTLSADYLINQIKPLNPLLSGTLDTLTRVVPATVLRKYRRVNIGEILAVGRRA
jgi:2-polyprenyl-3-methyl-5-hydroxy-6-metoxy-1,4-benzoquinol methylase